MSTRKLSPFHLTHLSLSTLQDLAMRLSSQLGCGAFALLLLASGCDAQSCSSVQVPITSCTASSAYPGYGCQNAYDGNAATDDDRAAVVCHLRNCTTAATANELRHAT